MSKPQNGQWIAHLKAIPPKDFPLSADGNPQFENPVTVLLRSSRTIAERLSVVDTIVKFELSRTVIVTD